jgi:hypothetical protein
VLFGEHGADEADDRGSVGGPPCQFEVSVGVVAVGVEGSVDGAGEVPFEASTSFRPAIAFSSFAREVIPSAASHLAWTWRW